MNDPFANYDTWLSTDRLAEAYEAQAEALMEAWSAWAIDNDVPVEAIDPEHPEAAIYVAWGRLMEYVDGYHAKVLEPLEQPGWNDPVGTELEPLLTRLDDLLMAAADICVCRHTREAHGPCFPDEGGDDCDVCVACPCVKFVRS